MPWPTSTWLFLVLSSATSSPDGPEPVRAHVLSFDELQHDLNDASLRLLDLRPKTDYDRGHVPGALHVDIKPLQLQAALPGGLQDTGRWSELLAPLGLQPGQRVVIYDAKRQLDAARLWWLLGYLGVDDVSLIDGGFPLWVRERRPTSTHAETAEPSTISIRLRPERLATLEEVKHALEDQSASIVDARGAKEYSGEEMMSKRGGHIPSARQLEWTDLVDSEGRFVPVATVRRLMMQAGVDPTRPAITHCQGGGRAAVNTFVLNRTGVPARNYYRGWSEWGNDESCPVEAAPR